MRELRIRLRLRSSYITAFHADTLFGHLCWAIAYRHGEEAVGALLAAYADSPPLLISDGFPLVGQCAYVPMPLLPPADPAKLQALLDIQDDLQDRRLFVDAVKRVAKKSFVAASALLALGHQGLSDSSILRQIFTLNWCPRSCDVRAQGVCACQNWRECPALNPARADCRQCAGDYPEEPRMGVMHNAVNRFSQASEQLYAQEEIWPGHEIYFLAAIDEARFTIERLDDCLAYLQATGFGKDRSLGKGAIAEYCITDADIPVPAGANAFISLSSAYMPLAGELTDRDWYQPYVKYGKLSGEYALDTNPYKRPLAMLRAGAVFAGTPGHFYGGLMPHVHYERPEVVQYAYAYPLWVKRDDE